MPTEQDLHETYHQMETGDLLKIIARKTDYTELAVSVALTELKNRNVIVDDVESAPPLEDEYKKLWTKNCLFDLSPFQKACSYFFGMFNYFLGFVLGRITWRWAGKSLYSPGFKSNGFLLKSNQYNYYAIAGFCFFILSAILRQQAQYLFPLTWIGGFALCFAFDAGHNKQRQIDKLNEIIDQGELPWEY